MCLCERSITISLKDMQILCYPSQICLICNVKFERIINSGKTCEYKSNQSCVLPNMCLEAMSSVFKSIEPYVFNMNSETCYAKYIKIFWRNHVRKINLFMYFCIRLWCAQITVILLCINLMITILLFNIDWIYKNNNLLRL